MMLTFGWLIGAAALLYLLHRLALRMEARGWIYYRNKRGSSGSLGAAFLEVQTLFEPGKRHAIEIMKDDDAQDDHSGDPPPAR